MLGICDRSIVSYRIINAPEFTGIKFCAPEYPLGTMVVVNCQVRRGRLWWKKYTMEYAVQCLTQQFDMAPNGSVDDLYVWETLIIFPTKDEAREFAKTMTEHIASVI